MYSFISHSYFIEKELKNRVLMVQINHRKSLEIPKG